ncbi:hypothetical protein PAAG_04152 [Paracoccidioides lutzii Pb01]|uniref:Uncharacterized protein n=1 Tax=Paracoccidioides lutzii (strain ATCC MYA-826 / Pb01) TaxID=502779 RepID=C1H058_PARBA|nr:hypothetical protein PAAG_04152 [Paracoccidioides lutzii Pb01]EEH33099.2 hypothetical protein PAAG_04152 [Paracoccidioides lutzii Pb01]
MWKENYPSSHALKHLTPINEYVASDLNNRSGTRLETFGIFVFPSQPTTSLACSASPGRHAGYGALAPTATQCSPLTDGKSTDRRLSTHWLRTVYSEMSTPFKSVGFSEYCVFNGREFRRKRGTQQWIESEELEGNLPTLDRALRLSLIQQNQADDEPQHWSASFSNAYNLAVVTDAQALIVKQVAENEPPPRAVNRQAVVENCQGWTIRVIAKLVARGIVDSAKLEMARSMVQPI